jgi:hypothetical protein
MPIFAAVIVNRSRTIKNKNDEKITFCSQQWHGPYDGHGVNPQQLF